MMLYQTLENVINSFTQLNSTSSTWIGKKEKHPGPEAIWDIYQSNHYCPTAKILILKDVPGS